MSFDIHYFGDYAATSPDDGRIPYGFVWTYPKHTPGYREHLAAGLRAETYANERYELSTHTLKLGFFDLDTADLVTAINDALKAIVPGVRWYVTASGQALTLSTSIRGVEHSEPYSVDVDGRRGTAIDFTLTCTPGWEASEASVTLTPPDTHPNVYAVSDLPGSMPASFRLAMTFDQATTGLDIGFRHADPTGLSLVQDYDGTSDATALGGEYAGATMNAGGVALGTPDILDCNAHRGWWLAVARLRQPDATPADTTYVARSTVTGSGIFSSESVDSEAVAATVTNAYEYVRLGPVPIPAAPIPDIETGSGYAAVTEGNAYQDGVRTLTSYNRMLEFAQSFAGFDGEIVSFEYRVVNAALYPWVKSTLYLYESSIGTPPLRTVSLVTDPLTIGKHIIPIQPLAIKAGKTYVFSLYTERSLNTWTVGLAYSNGDYAGGTLTTPIGAVGSGVSPDDDLTFSVNGRTRLGFNSSVGIIAKNSGGGTGRNDVVALVPFDEYAMLADITAAADQGVLLDAAEPDEVTCYLTNTSGGIAAVDQAKVEHIGQPVIWPGDTAIQIVPHTPGNAAPTGGDVTLSYKARYMTPYGG